LYRRSGEAKIFQAGERFQSVLGLEFEVASFFES
jgi:hypothetical protein